MIETLVVMTLLGVLTLFGASPLVRWRQQQRLEGALRHLALAVTRTCASAAATGRTHALRFENGGGQLRCQ